MGKPPVAPQFQKVSTQRFRREHVKRRERLVHEQDVRVNNERACKPTRWRMPPDSSRG